MLYVLYKAGLNKTGFLIILTFWSGLFQYLGEIAGAGIYHTYKIGLVVVAFSLSWRRILKITSNYDIKINVVFTLFSISFWVSYFIYHGDLLTILSQYLFKYGFIFLLYHYFKDIEYDKKKQSYTANLILLVLFIQVGLSIVKVLLIGVKTDIQIYEPVVGSMSSGGAGLAVVLPILALVFYWVWKEGSFKRKDWYIVMSFLIISFASAKRQPIVFFPLILYMLISLTRRKFKIFNLLKYTPLVIVLFITGVKLNPSFNPENRIWGSFDWDFLSRYMSEYYFGTSDINSVLSGNIDTGMGRGAGLVYYFYPNKMTLISTKEILFGKGLYETATGAKGRFTGLYSDYGLTHQGLMGNAGLLLYSIGYLGTILMVILAVTIIRKMKDKRIASIILFYFFWDFLFYYNQVLFSNQGAVIVFFIIFYSNFLYYSEKQTQVSIQA